MKRRIILFSMITLTVILLALIASQLAVRGVKGYFESPGPLEQEKTLMIAQGTGFKSIVRQLEQEQVLNHPELYSAILWYLDRARNFKAGEYRFPAGVSPQRVTEMLVKGEVVIRKITIPEGLTVKQIYTLVQNQEDLSGTLPPLVPEGELRPETYHYHLNTTRSEIISRMRKAQKELLTQLWNARDESIPLQTPQQALILASIVERETGIAEERPAVAAVFYNRMRTGMRLQSDPTVIYGISNGLGVMDRLLTRKDLAVEHPYNTYVIPGLPPAPIANPGKASLEAVLNPIQSEDFYFVADGKGGHVFARTLEEHNRNVAAYRRALREAAAASRE
jgi:UPF0755 protein